MARIDRLKRSVGTAVRRRKPSRAAQWLAAAGVVHGRVLDYGCGFGLDAETYGWDAFDPLYRPREPTGAYDTIVCTLVLNVLSRTNRTRVIQRIQVLLEVKSMSYEPRELGSEISGRRAMPTLRAAQIGTTRRRTATGSMQRWQIQKTDCRLRGLPGV